MMRRVRMMRSKGEDGDREGQKEREGKEGEKEERNEEGWMWAIFFKYSHNEKSSGIKTI